MEMTNAALVCHGLIIHLGERLKGGYPCYKRIFYSLLFIFNALMIQDNLL